MNIEKHLADESANNLLHPTRKSGVAWSAAESRIAFALLVISFLLFLWNIYKALRPAKQPDEKEITMEVKGRDLVAGIPKTLKLTSEEIREALHEPISQIVEALKQALEETPPELAADIVDRGIVMTGGGSLLRGLDTLFKEETNLPINVVDDPLLCVVLGAGKVLDNVHLYDRILMHSMHD